MTHPLAPLSQLPDIAPAVEKATDSIARVHRHFANRKKWDITGGMASLRSAHASALLESPTPHNMPEEDPYLVGALRLAQELDPASEDKLNKILGVFRRAPLQACAHLHTLAAKNFEEETTLGRPVDSPEIVERLQALKEIIHMPQMGVSATIISAIVHAEICVLEPFRSMNGIVARAASRMVLASCGTDPHNLTVPEAYWLKKRNDYAQALQAYTTGTAQGVRTWLLMHLTGLYEGAIIAWDIAEKSLQK